LRRVGPEGKRSRPSTGHMQHAGHYKGLTNPQKVGF